VKVREMRVIRRRVEGMREEERKESVRGDRGRV